MTKEELFKQQKETMDILLEHGAINLDQYTYSLTHLAEKMGIDLSQYETKIPNKN